MKHKKEGMWVFGYGSLMHKSSLWKTVPSARNAFPGLVEGFRRSFNISSTRRFDPDAGKLICVLNLVPGESDDRLNGVCFEIDPESYGELIDREKIYEAHKVKVRHYKYQDTSVDASIFWARRLKPYRYLLGSRVQDAYLDLCIEGCSLFGEEFVNDFKSTTDFWGISPDVCESRIWEPRLHKAKAETRK